MRRSRRMSARSLKTVFTEFVSEEYIGTSSDLSPGRFVSRPEMKRSVSGFSDFFNQSVHSFDPRDTFPGQSSVEDSGNRTPDMPTKKKEQRWSFNAGPSARYTFTRAEPITSQPELSDTETTAETAAETVTETAA